VNWPGRAVGADGDVVEFRNGATTLVDSMDIASAVGAKRLLAVWLNETSATSARKSIAGGGTSVR
jgi:hypothetical protein